jgi:hypothetical protein
VPAKTNTTWTERPRLVPNCRKTAGSKLIGLTELIHQRGGVRSLNTLAFVVVLLVTGCQRSDKVRVTGRVLLHNGTPLKGASIIARSDETGKWAKGTTDADGRYELGTGSAGDGIPPGDYHVIIMEDLGDSARNTPTIPAKYVNQATSKLQLTVTNKSVVFDIKLDPS